MGKRIFSAEFKTRLVLQLLSEEEEVGTLASKHEINPNQLRTWKTQFLANAAKAFDDPKVAKEAAEREREGEKKQAAMLKTIGQLTLERDFLMAEAHARNKGKGVLLR